MQLLNFVFAESALELVPKDIWGQPAVASDARRRGLKAGEMLLDRSFHYSAMAKLRDSEKRGRPDLVHVALLSVTGTPLYLRGEVKVYVHTYPGLVVELAVKTRIPKNYLRFRGLVEKSLVERPTEGLVKVYNETVPELVRKVRAQKVFGLSVRGRQTEVPELAGEVAATTNPCVIMGGFPHGHFSGEVEKAIDEMLRIDPMPLEAHVVAARVVYEVEKAAKGFND